MINPLMPKSYFCTSNLVYKKQMLQAANTDLFHPLVLKAHNAIVSVKIYYFLYKLSQ